jgi:adenosylhomocysteine nucleosidase
MLLVLESGLGRKAMESAITGIMCQPGPGGPLYRPPFLVLAGFSGALQSRHNVGALILATDVVDERGGYWPATWPGDRPTTAARGRVLTVEAIVANPVGKRELGARHGALAVDMESAAAARLCHEHGVPFGCLRAVSDDIDTELSPALLGLLRGGRPSPRGVLAAIARRPQVVREMWRLARSTRRAAQQLAAALDKMIPAAATDRS